MNHPFLELKTKVCVSFAQTKFPV